MDRIDTFIAAALCLAAAILFTLVAMSDAYPHEAPTGWAYPWACCSGMDCAPIPASDVEKLPSGYRVTLHKGDHPFAVEDEPLVYDIPYDSKKIKDAPDGMYHICLRSPNTVTNGDIEPLQLLCFFRGAEGF